MAKKKNEITVFDTLPSQVVYSASQYGILPQYTGEKVKILVIDSGLPKHKDILVKGEFANFCGEKKQVEDIEGHSTIVSGIIAARNKESIVGVAPNSIMYYAKVADKTGYIGYNSIISAILWGVIKEVNIITMAIGFPYDYKLLHDAIIKAYNSGICIIAAAGEKIEDNKEIEYPAQYKEVFSVGCLPPKKKDIEIVKQKVNLALKDEIMFTTYLKNKYIKVGGASGATAIVSGLTSLLIEKNKLEKKEYTPATIYEELSKLSV